MYRLYDAADRLIYIGASHHLPLRMRGHELRSWFYSLVRRVDFTDYPTREDALAAEAIAIQEEAPVYNVMHRQGHYRFRDFADWTADDVRICSEWLAASPNNMVPLAVRDFLRAASVPTAVAA